MPDCPLRPLPQIELKILFGGAFLPAQCSRLPSGTHWAAAVIKPLLCIQTFSFRARLSLCVPELRAWGSSLLQRTHHLGLRLHHFLHQLHGSPHVASPVPRPQAVACLLLSPNPNLYSRRRSQAEQVCSTSVVCGTQ